MIQFELLTYWDKTIFRLALKTGLLVGTLLVCINIILPEFLELPKWLELGLKVLLNFAVPFCVSSYSALRSRQELTRLEV